jgi:hypothetical protein
MAAVLEENITEEQLSLILFLRGGKMTEYKGYS